IIVNGTQPKQLAIDHINSQRCDTPDTTYFPKCTARSTHQDRHYTDHNHNSPTKTTATPTTSQPTHNRTHT
ncbi:hypothetical protein, partial [Mycobacterium lepromatosis]|uniref:hypothetical protein n=2 Tax=Mycobacterium lepromatosis TaxID=480418 RepID=UPI000A701E31